MKKMTILLTTIFFAVVTIQTALAQGNPGDPGDGEDPDSAIPLDGGLFSVLGSGLAIGAYKLIRKKQEQ